MNMSAIIISTILTSFFSCAISQTFAGGHSNKKIDVNPVTKFPTILPTRSNNSNYTLNSTVGTIRYDSSRNFTKWIFPINRHNKQNAVNTYPTKVLSTQIYIESDDSAISINRSKKGKTVQPTTAPTSFPTTISQPTYGPTTSRTAPPSVAPTVSTVKAVQTPSILPTKLASLTPTISPSKVESAVPTTSPTKKLSVVPTTSPTKIFSIVPTTSPTKIVSVVPTILPTTIDSAEPTTSPTKSVVPTISPTTIASVVPTISLSKVVQTPSLTPTICPTNEVKIPTVANTFSPAKLSPPKGTSAPTNSPLPSARPTSTAPTSVPSQTAAPSLRRSAMPSTAKPSAKPSLRPPSASPTSLPPSSVPSGNPLATPTTAPDSLKYNPGSKIMTGTVNLYNIYFGFFPAYPFLNSSQQTVNLVNYFSANIGDSSWYKTVTSYYHINSDGSKTYASASVVLKKSVLYQTAAKGRTVVDTDIVNAIVSKINDQQLPIDENGIYNVFFRGDFLYSGWLTQWCAFHSSFAMSNGAILKYTVQGDPSTAPINSQLYCEGSLVSPTVNGNTGADSIVNVLAHEIAETVTDFNDAWNEGSITTEIGDICGWKFMLGNNSGTANWNVVVGKQRFLVQSLYRVGYGCVLSCC